MAKEGIAWENWTRLREDGYDLIYLMREGEPKYSWEEWMEGFTDELKASYKAYREQRLAQKKLDRKIGFFLALILTKLEKVESLLAEEERSRETDEEISSRLECIKDYIKHVIRLQDQGGKHNEAGQNTSGSADGTPEAEHSEAGLHRSGAVVPSGA